MQQPRIGITTSYSEGEQRLDHRYVRAVEAAGGIPIIVPMLANREHALAFSQLLDGLMITGGPGITRGIVGDLPPDLEPVDPVRDESDALIYSLFEQDSRPVLGICYGMQFINAQAGGTLYGDLSDYVDAALEHSPKRGGQDHTIAIERNSQLYHLLNREQLMVNTYHLQSLERIGAGLRAVAYSPDGVIEAIEGEDGRIIGVQFHPEKMISTTAPLFAHLVERAANVR